jgi:hypothetical protein
MLLAGGHASALFVRRSSVVDGAKVLCVAQGEGRRLVLVGEFSTAMVVVAMTGRWQSPLVPQRSFGGTGCVVDYLQIPTGDATGAS